MLLVFCGGFFNMKPILDAEIIKLNLCVFKNITVATEINMLEPGTRLKTIA